MGYSLTGFSWCNFILSSSLNWQYRGYFLYWSVLTSYLSWPCLLWWKTAVQQPLVCHFMKGALRLLPFSKPISTCWDLAAVLEALTTSLLQYLLEENDLKMLSLKVALLLCVILRHSCLYSAHLWETQGDHLILLLSKKWLIHAHQWTFLCHFAFVWTNDNVEGYRKWAVCVKLFLGRDSQLKFD